MTSALLLTAGLGTRLRPLSDVRAKRRSTLRSTLRGRSSGLGCAACCPAGRSPRKMLLIENCFFSSGTSIHCIALPVRPLLESRVAART